MGADAQIDYSKFDDVVATERLEGGQQGIYLLEIDLLKCWRSVKDKTDIGLAEFTVIESQKIPNAKLDIEPLPPGSRFKVMKYFQGQNEEIYFKLFRSLGAAALNKRFYQVTGAVLKELMNPDTPEKARGLKVLARGVQTDSKAKHPYVRFDFFPVGTPMSTVIGREGQAD